MKKLVLAFAIWMAAAGIALAAVNINTATKDELVSVKGIGEKTARPAARPAFSIVAVDPERTYTPERSTAAKRAVRFSEGFTRESAGISGSGPRCNSIRRSCRQ